MFAVSMLAGKCVDVVGVADHVEARTCFHRTQFIGQVLIHLKPITLVLRFNESQRHSYDASQWSSGFVHMGRSHGSTASKDGLF